MATKLANAMLVYNLRFRWPKELASIADNKLIELYDDFAISELYGNNDEHFLQYVKDCTD